MQLHHSIMRMSHIQYFHKQTSVRRGSHPVVLVGAPYSSDDLFQLLQDSLFLLMYCDLGHAQRLCIYPCLLLKEQDVNKGIFLIGQLSQCQMQLIFSHLAEIWRPLRFHWHPKTAWRCHPSTDPKNPPAGNDQRRDRF